MDLFLDGDGPVYRQVARALRGAIVAGRLPHGTRVPPSRELAQDLGVSRNTVVAAYEELRLEGLLSGRVGAGSYVQSAKPPPGRPVRLRRPVAPQSEFARRGRQVHDPAEWPFGLRKPGLRYAFQFGFPMVSRTLAATWAREVARAAPYVGLDYPERQGSTALRRAIAAHVTRSRGVRCGPEDVLVVDGTQQAISLVADVLVDRGDDVVMEDPHYRAMRKVFQLHGATIVGVGVDAHGLKTAELPQRPAKLVAVTPSHQFPTGAVLSLERRRALLDYASRAGGWILEDDYDGEFRYGTEAVSALQAMDRDGRVIYVGTFSKTLSPACRLGFLIMAPGLRDDFLTAKWAADLGTPPLEQAALAHFIESGGYERHLRQVTRILGERRDALVQALRELLGSQCDFRESHAGMHILVRLEGLSAADEDALVRLAEQRGLGLYPARICYLQPSDTCSLIMGFSTLPAREIRDAVALLADCIAEVRARQRPLSDVRRMASR
jgi:GntR family transcriptional regulator/MocR family aminotransferase